MAEYSTNNPFYKIIHGELKTDKVYEDDFVIAINDLHPAAPIHILVMPKTNFLSFDDFVEKSSTEDVARFFKTVKEIAKSKGLSESGYKLIANHKESSGQTVFHFHMHILGGGLLKDLSRV